MRLAVLAERVTDAVAVPSSSACYRLLHITDSSHACQSSKLLGMAVETTQLTRCYLQHQPFQERERGSEGETRRAGLITDYDLIWDLGDLGSGRDLG